MPFGRWSLFEDTESNRFPLTTKGCQLTPPGSACSIVIGTGITEMAPGSQQGLQVVVADVQAAREHLVERGVAASEVDTHDWGSFVYFSDPDGNTWSVQQLPERSGDRA